MDIAHLANDISRTLVKVVVGAAVGGLVTAIVPLGIPIATGAIFCGTAALVGEAVDSIFRNLGLEGKSGLSHAISRTVTVLIAAGAAAGIASLMGFPITFVGGLAILGIIALAELTAWVACKIVSEIGKSILHHYHCHRRHHHRI